MSTSIDPNHANKRRLLRSMGVAFVALGLLFTVIGVASFFSAFGTFEPPRYFWCAFVGLPLLFVGLTLCQVAFFGAFFRFFAGESAPVGKDTFNYMAEGTQEGVRTIAKAVGEGLAGGSIRCALCGHTTSGAAKFCGNCGTALSG